MTIKPFCSAKQAIAAIEALTTIVDDGVAPDTISKVVVRVPPPYARMIAMKPEAGARASTIVSAAFQMGLAAYRRERLYDIERADAMEETAALAFAGKVEIVADESLLEFFPANFPAEVEVTPAARRCASASPPPPAIPAARSTTPRSPTRRSASSATASAARPIEIGLDGLDSEDGCKRLADAMWQAASMDCD